MNVSIFIRQKESIGNHKKNQNLHRRAQEGNQTKSNGVSIGYLYLVSNASFLSRYHCIVESLSMCGGSVFIIWHSIDVYIILLVRRGMLLSLYLPHTYCCAQSPRRRQRHQRWRWCWWCYCLSKKTTTRYGIIWTNLLTYKYRLVLCVFFLFISLRLDV